MAEVTSRRDVWIETGVKRLPQSVPAVTSRRDVWIETLRH